MEPERTAVWVAPYVAAQSPTVSLGDSDIQQARIKLAHLVLHTVLPPNTQANSATQLSASGQVVYQVENARSAFSFSSLINDQESVDATEGHDVSLSYLRSLPKYKRNWWFLLGELQSNEELGIDLRVLGAGGLGELFVQTYRSDFLVAAGIAVSEEYAASSSDKFTSTELLGYTSYSYSTQQCAY